MFMPKKKYCIEKNQWLTNDVPKRYHIVLTRNGTLNRCMQQMLRSDATPRERTKISMRTTLQCSSRRLACTVTVKTACCLPQDMSQAHTAACCLAKLGARCLTTPQCGILNLRQCPGCARHHSGWLTIADNLSVLTQASYHQCDKGKQYLLQHSHQFLRIGTAKLQKILQPKCFETQIHSQISGFTHYSG